MVLNFDALQCDEFFGEYYAGGSGDLGSGPGPDYGITFSDNAQAAMDNSLCPHINATNEPSFPNSLYFLTGAAATMDVPAGFTGGFSFYYAAPNHPGFINVWSGLDGTGTLLASLALPLTGACDSVVYCDWNPIGVSFSGVAQSVDFGGSADYIAFDNITLGVGVVVNPEKAAGNPLNQPGSPVRGEPISVATGNVFDSVTDYTTPGPNVLDFTRYYNSLASAQTFASTLGRNWRSSYDRYLRLISDSSVTAERADGQQVNFNFDGSNWIPDSDVDLSLTQSGSTWTLTDHSDTIETYTALGAEAVLTSIRLRGGYTQRLTYDVNNFLVRVTDALNQTLQFSYQNGLLSQLITPDGLVVNYAFGSSGVTPGALDQLNAVVYGTTSGPENTRQYIYADPNLPFALTAVLDENGDQWATWTYDAFGRGLSSQHGTGSQITTIAYNDSDGSRTVTNALGEQELYSFTTLQGVPKVTEIDRLEDPLPAASRFFTYDSNGYLASQTDWNGNLTTFSNDAHGQSIEIDEAVGTPQQRSTTISYHSQFHLPVQIVTDGLTTAFTYDANGNLLSRTDVDTTSTTAPYTTAGATRTWTFTWSNFQLTSVREPRSDVSARSTFAYTAAGQISSVTNALGQQLRIGAHSGSGLPLSAEDANGVTTQFAYDARQRLLSGTVMTSAGPLTTNYTYDAAGNLIAFSLPDGATLYYGYDSAHRLVSLSDLPTVMDTASFGLDALDDRIFTAISGNGPITYSHSGNYDALGRLVQDIGGSGQTSAYTYDSNGNRISIIDPLGHITQQSFDSLNRLVQIVDPANAATNLAYDSHDRPVAATDAKRATKTYVYDGFGDVIQETSPAKGTSIYRYDPAGNLIQRIDGRGAVANYTYDALNRPLSISYPGNPAENVTYRYDENGHGKGIGRLTSLSDAAGILSRSYDERGNLLSESRSRNGVTLLTSYQYDAAGRIASISYPSGLAVSYVRDAMGRITGVSAKPKGAGAALPVLSNVGYQPLGPVNGRTFGNGLTEMRNYDLDYRLSQVVTSGGKPLQNLNYHYDADSNATTIVDAIAAADNQAFSYDALNRLTSASGGYGTLAYRYDVNGNRLTENAPDFTTLDGLAQVTSLNYNQAGRLASVMSGTKALAQYTYDAFGQRLAETGSATALTNFQYDASGNLLEESDAQGSPKADYIYVGRTPVAEVTPSAKFYFLHTDRLGTPQIATDIAQGVSWLARYQPFGSLTGSSQTAGLGQDLRLPGQEADADTGLYHNDFRDYIPGLGRYAQPDPLGMTGGFNIYSYANDNPISSFDPLGLFSWWDIGIGSAEIVGGVLGVMAAAAVEAPSLGTSTVAAVAFGLAVSHGLAELGVGLQPTSTTPDEQTFLDVYPSNPGALAGLGGYAFGPKVGRITESVGGAFWDIGSLIKTGVEAVGNVLQNQSTFMPIAELITEDVGALFEDLKGGSSGGGK